MNKGQLIVVSGPSGVGKSTVISTLTAKLARKPFFSISATTRNKRPNEYDGVQYHFVSKSKFESMLEQGELLEHTVYAEHYYGTPAAPVRERLALGQDVLLDVEVDGALQVRRNYADAILIFVVAPSISELERRLRSRGDTEETSIRLRLQTALKEYTIAKEYDYVVCNDNVERCADRILSILCAEQCRAKNYEALLKEAQNYVISPNL